MNAKQSQHTEQMARRIRLGRNSEPRMNANEREYKTTYGSVLVPRPAQSLQRSSDIHLKNDISYSRSFAFIRGSISGPSIGSDLTAKLHHAIGMVAAAFAFIRVHSRFPILETLNEQR